jgi:hypothetical protein
MSNEISSVYNKLHQLPCVLHWKNWAQTHPLQCAASAIIIGSATFAAVSLVRSNWQQLADRTAHIVIDRETLAQRLGGTSELEAIQTLVQTADPRLEESPPEVTPVVVQSPSSAPVSENLEHQVISPAPASVVVQDPPPTPVPENSPLQVITPTTSVIVQSPSPADPRLEESPPEVTPVVVQSPSSAPVSENLEHQVISPAPAPVVVQDPPPTPVPENSQLQVIIPTTSVIVQSPSPKAIEQNRSYQERALDKRLQITLRASNFKACRELIKQGACPNIKNHKGLTPFKEALQGRDLIKCKFLIDNGVIPDAEDLKELEKLLTARKYTSIDMAMRAFPVKRPNPHEPEIFLDDRFQSLEKLARRSPQDLERLTHGIALLNIADESFDAPSYGIITEKFSPSLNSWYAKIAANFTVVRVLVDKRKKLDKTTTLVKKLLPKLPLLHWALDGHANAEVTDLSAKERFTIHNGKILEKVAEQVDFLGTMSLWGCKCAAGDVDNLATQFSKYGRIMFASPILVSGVVCEMRYDQDLQKPVLVTFFEKDGQSLVKAYADGKLLVSGAIENKNDVFDVVLSTLKAKPQPSGS